MSASALTAGLTGAAAGQGKPVSFLLATASQTISSATPGTDIVTLVRLETARIEESGNHQPAVCDFEITDTTLAYTAIRGEWPVLITANTPSGIDRLFLGFIRQSRGKIQAIYGGIVVSAYDFSSLLDRCLVKVPFLIRSGVSDKAAIQSCFDILGGPLTQWLGGAGLDWSKVQHLGDLDTNLTMTVGLSLRQCIERILGNVTASGNYFMDARPRLWTWDDGSKNAALTAAPYDINVTPAPAAGEIAPQNLEISWDTQRRIAGYIVQGNGPGGSGAFTDKDMLPAALRGTAFDTYDGRILPGPWSTDLFGDSWDILSAPNATNPKQAIRLARAALTDTRNPIPQGSFSVEGTSCYSGSLRWQAGQLVYITSAVQGLTGRNPDTRPWAGATSSTAPGTEWALQPFRIVRATTTFLSGRGDRCMEIEVGGRRPHMYGGT